MLDILLVEDDPIIGESLKLAFDLNNIKLTQKFNIEETRILLEKKQFDLILLDINLPDGKGHYFCEELKNKKVLTPIIIITANLDEETALQSFNMGANDFIRKPFSTKELILRIKARVKDKNENTTISLGDLIIDLDARKIEFKKKELFFPRKEFELLKFFASRIDNVFSREKIMDILNSEQNINDRTIDSHISHLRVRLKNYNCNHISIKSVYGVGYKLTLDKNET